MKRIPYSFIIPIVYILYQHYCEKEDYVTESNTISYNYNNVPKSNFTFPRINIKEITEKNHELHDILLKSENAIDIDSLAISEDNNDYIKSPTPCHSLSVQIETQLERIKKIEKIANKSNREEGYREARDVQKKLPPVFFEPTHQEKGTIRFKVNVGTVGFVHSHTLSESTRGFYSLEDVKVFLYLVDLVYKNIENEIIKSFTIYDLYSILIYGNQIYSMKIDNLSLYKKFHENENNLKINMIYRLDVLYKNPDIHFNYFKDNYYSFPDENKEALNKLASKILSHIGVRIYKLENYDKRNKEPRWRKLLSDENGNGIFVNPC